MPAGNHLIGSCDYGRGFCFVLQTQRLVDAGGRAFDLRQRPDDFTRLLLAGDVEVLQGALGLRAPQAVGGYFDGTEGVALCTCILNCAHGVGLTCQNRGLEFPA
ncbi:hypothetical protein D9M73_81070 [compost metagenome]